jgi:hypothetical protein
MATETLKSTRCGLAVCVAWRAATGHLRRRRRRRRALPTPPPRTTLNNAHNQKPNNRKKTRQGSVEPFTLVEGPDAWYAAQYRDNQAQWVTELSAAHVAELDAAVEAVVRSGVQDIHVR